MSKSLSVGCASAILWLLAHGDFGGLHCMIIIVIRKSTDSFTVITHNS